MTELTAARGCPSRVRRSLSSRRRAGIHPVTKQPAGGHRRLTGSRHSGNRTNGCGAGLPNQGDGQRGISMNRAANDFGGRFLRRPNPGRPSDMLSAAPARVARWLAVVILGIGVAMPVLAQPGPGKGQWRERQQSREEFRGRDPRGPQMSPEERRDLRRDIITHGREHYRGPGRPPPPPRRP